MISHYKRFMPCSRMLQALFVIVMYSLFLELSGEFSSIAQAFQKEIGIEVQSPHSSSIPNGKVLWTKKFSYLVSRDGQYDPNFVFSADRLSIGIEQSLKIFKIIDAKTGNLIRTINLKLRSDRAIPVLSSDFSMAAIPLPGYMFELRYTQTGKLVNRFKARVARKYREGKPFDYLYHYLFMDDNNSIAVLYPDGILRIWDIKGGKLRKMLRLYDKKSKPQFITAMMFSDDGEILAAREQTGSGEQAYSIERINFWNCKTGKMMSRTPEMSFNTTLLGFLKNKKEFTVANDIEAWGSASRDIITFNVYNSSILRKTEWYPADQMHGWTSMSVAQNRRFAAFKPGDPDEYGDKVAYLLNLQSGKTAAHFPVDVGNDDLALSPNGDRLAVLKKDGTLTLWASPSLK